VTVSRVPEGSEPFEGEVEEPLLMIISLHHRDEGVERFRSNFRLFR
jgi:hypothetical protein